MGVRTKAKKGLELIGIIIVFLQCALLLLGFFIGNAIGEVYSDIGTNAGSVVLIILGYEMTKGAIKNLHKRSSNNIVLLIFLGGSIEELLMAISLGALQVNYFLFIVIFGFVTFIANTAALKLSYTKRLLTRLPVDIMSGVSLLILGILNLLQVL